jgi:hypothetical protein
MEAIFGTISDSAKAAWASFQLGVAPVGPQSLNDCADFAP